jgi:hypothetical protein
MTQIEGWAMRNKMLQFYVVQYLLLSEQFYKEEINYAVFNQETYQYG